VGREQEAIVARPEIEWTQDNERPAVKHARVGRVYMRVLDAVPVSWTISIDGLEGQPGADTPGGISGTAETVEDAKAAVVELVPTVLVAYTSWLYEGAPGWVITAMQPEPPPLLTTAVEKAALCRRLGLERGIGMDPRLVADVVELTPAQEGDIMAEYGAEALVRYYCPHDPRLREIRPKVASKWVHAKTQATYQVIGIGRLQTDVRELDMAEVVLYGNPGDPMIWTRPLDEFMDGRFQIPPENVVKLVDVQDRPGGAGLALVTEDDELEERDDGDDTVGMACAKCGQWVGAYHMFGCDAATPKDQTD